LTLYPKISSNITDLLENVKVLFEERFGGWQEYPLKLASLKNKKFAKSTAKELLYILSKKTIKLQELQKLRGGENLEKCMFDKTLTADKFLQQEPIIQQLKQISTDDSIMPNGSLSDWLDLHFLSLPVTTRDIESLFGKLAKLKQRFSAAKIPFLSAELFRGYTTLRASRDELIEYIKLVRKENIKITEFDLALKVKPLPEAEEQNLIKLKQKQDEDNEEIFLDFSNNNDIEVIPPKAKRRFTEVKYNDKRSTYKQMQDIINNSQELAKEEIATELNNTKNTKRKKDHLTEITPT